MAHGRNALVTALALYLAWTAATWLLEGRIETFLRPDAVIDRLTYVAVANLFIGILGSAFAICFAVDSGIDLRSAGFGPDRPSTLGLIAGLAAGLFLYFVQGAPSLDPIVIVNAYAQVFAVSVAEVLVCWTVVGAAFRQSFGGTGAPATIGAAIVAGGLFGLYHFGHSAPFNTVGMVALLAGVGLVTSAFFFVSRDVYATILFHNFLAVYGVVQALAASGKLESYATLQPALLTTALASIVMLIAADRLIIRRPPA